MSGKALGLAPARHDEATTLLYRLGFRGRSTLLKLAAVIAIEVVIVFGYVGHGAIDHYALHPMIAMASALPLFLLVRTLGFRLREELLISYFFLNFARFPDYLFEAGIEHQNLDERLSAASGIRRNHRLGAGLLDRSSPRSWRSLCPHETTRFKSASDLGVTSWLPASLSSQS